MNKLGLVLLTAGLLTAGCGKKSASNITDIGPRISDGYYSIENAENYNVPMVAVKKVDGVTYAYSFYRHVCDSKILATYGKTGTTFSNSPVSLGGPSVTSFMAGQTCELKTDIDADSDSTIKISVKVNGVDLEPYRLKKVPKERFLTDLLNESKASDSFEVKEVDCQASLGETCSVLQIESKE